MERIMVFPVLQLYSVVDVLLSHKIIKTHRVGRIRQTHNRKNMEFLQVTYYGVNTQEVRINNHVFLTFFLSHHPMMNGITSNAMDILYSNTTTATAVTSIITENQLCQCLE